MTPDGPSSVWHRQAFSPKTGQAAASLSRHSPPSLAWACPCRPWSRYFSSGAPSTTNWSHSLYPSSEASPGQTCTSALSQDWANRYAWPALYYHATFSTASQMLLIGPSPFPSHFPVYPPVIAAIDWLHHLWRPAAAPYYRTCQAPRVVTFE